KNITDRVWTSYVADRRSEGISDTTILGAGKVLRMLFSNAVKSGLMNATQVPKFTMPKASKSKEDYVSLEEFEKLLKVLPERFHAYATWQFYQATRKT